jgi:hypothetical protein
MLHITNNTIKETYKITICLEVVFDMITVSADSVLTKDFIRKIRQGEFVGTFELVSLEGRTYFFNASKVIAVTVE